MGQLKVVQRNWSNNSYVQVICNDVILQGLMIVTGCRFDRKKNDKFDRCSATFAALYHI